ALCGRRRYAQGAAMRGLEIARHSGPDAFREWRLRNAEHGRDAAQCVLLLAKPVRPAVPPRCRGKHRIEADPFERRKARPGDTGRPAEEEAGALVSPP